ncbi:MAG: polyprenyl synthetase family protein [Desulfobacterales bacterium]|nr:MAG: polyprenyl synthetase family protein [Desulfobacterales bacterium]
MNNADLSAYLSAKRQLVNGALNDILGQTSASIRIVAAMKHSLMAGGKRLRPTLCIAATEAVDGQIDDVMNAACAIEMIHTYSLIHDDLPAMDDDHLRRGKPTCHVAFDEPTAILAGDALLTFAFEILSSFQVNDQSNAVKWLTVIHTIATAAGHKGMIEGQMRDIHAEGGQSLSLTELEAMHALKTGALIEASITTGAILGGGGGDQIEQLKIYANNIGLAFQVTDDILNVEGDPDIMGKGVGTDHARQKSTYPAVLGIEKSKQFAKKLVNNALQALEYFDNKSDPLRAIAHYVIARRR